MMRLRLSELRCEKGVSQKEVASYLGVTQQAYANYELGKREPDIICLIKLSNYFNVTIDYLLGRTDDITPPNTQKNSDIVEMPDALHVFLRSKLGRDPTEEELSRVDNFFDMFTQSFKEGDKD